MICFWRSYYFLSTCHVMLQFASHCGGGKRLLNDTSHHHCDLQTVRWHSGVPYFFNITCTTRTTSNVTELQLLVVSCYSLHLIVVVVGIDSCQTFQHHVDLQTVRWHSGHWLLLYYFYDSYDDSLRRPQT